VHVVIMGCGRVGTALSVELERAGHTVAVIDQDEASFRRLPRWFAGRTIKGIGFDRDVMISAGIEEAGAFAAVSSGDNSNIIAARVARETFGVPTVVARIYDSRRAEIYQRLGIPTVASVQWATDQMLRRLVPEGLHRLWADPTGTVELVEVPVDKSWIGRPASRLSAATGASVAFVTRSGRALLPDADLVIQEGDLLHMFLTSDAEDRVRETVSRAPHEAD
jgi:trk system potassium uptake protein TrkA